MSKQELSYDTKNIITVILLVGAFPIGLLVMWRWKLWSKELRMLITLPVIILTAVLISLLMVAD